MTGRRTYCLLATPPLTPLHELQAQGTERSHIDLGTSPYTATELVAKVGGLLAPLVSTSPTQSESAVNAALTARSPPPGRSAARSPNALPPRPALGWIAVSGEDDMPHRPTNVPAPPFEQYEIPVTVPATGSHPELTVQTRFLIASPAAPASARTPHASRELPPDPEPEVPDGNNVILFLHGHVSVRKRRSRSSPCSTPAGPGARTKFSVISVDLPNCGYRRASTTRRWPSRAPPRVVWTHRQGADPHTRAGLVETSWSRSSTLSTRSQLTAIDSPESSAAASAGNLGLRLGRRMPDARLASTGDRLVNAAWSGNATSTTPSPGAGKCMNNWEASEFDDSRRNYSHEVYDTVVIPVVLLVTQPQSVLARGSRKRLHHRLRASRDARFASENLRKWHWRVAGEQLIFSHVDRVDRWDSNSPWRYGFNVVEAPSRSEARWTTHRSNHLRRRPERRPA